jgi:hypothetical protein
VKSLSVLAKDISGPPRIRTQLSSNSRLPIRPAQAGSRLKADSNHHHAEDRAGRHDHMEGLAGLEQSAQQQRPQRRPEVPGGVPRLNALSPALAGIRMSGNKRTAPQRSIHGPTRSEAAMRAKAKPTNAATIVNFAAASPWPAAANRPPRSPETPPIRAPARFMLHMQHELGTGFCSGRGLIREPGAGVFMES